MKTLLRRIFSSKLLCFALMFIEFFVVVLFWSFIEFDFIQDLLGPADPGSVLEIVEFIVSIVFNVLRSILFVLDVIVFFRIINRDENPEYKIPWLACMFLLPVWTLTFYIIFGKTSLRRKDKKIVLPTKKLLSEKAEARKEENEKLLEEMDPQYRGVFQYLRYTTDLDITKNNKITYYKNGEEWFPEFVESLKTAEKFILIEFFIISKGKWWTLVLDVLKEKAAQGVDVRVVYDDIGSSKVKRNMDIQLQKMGIKCYKFHPVMPLPSNVVNNRSHRKIVVIDNKIAFTGGMNLADEYANDEVRFGYWKDTMVKIEGKGIENEIATFLQDYDLSTFKLSNYDELCNAKYKEYKDPGYAFAFGDAPGAYQGFEQIGEQNYINLLNVATKRVDISTPYLITSYPLIRAVLAAAKRGVEVNLIVPGIPDKKMVYWMAKCSFHTFLKAGVNVYTYTPGFNHEKQMLVDDRLCFVGTINFDFRSLTHHFETGVTFLDAPCIKDIRKDFDEMIAQSEKVPTNFKAKAFERMVCAVLKMFRVLF